MEVISEDIVGGMQKDSTDGATDNYGVFRRVPVSGGVRARLVSAARAAHSDLSGMTHAWLFTGPPGSGRSVAAESFAAALLCTNPNLPGCGECEGCRTALAGTHGDLLRITTEGTVIRVEPLRAQHIPWAYRAPTTAAWRVVIVEDADRLTDESANALLKCVEEPPERTVFLMCAPTTNPRDFSVTLRSRSRHVYVPTPTADEVAQILRAESEELTEEQVAWAARISNGHIGRARGLAFDEGTRQWRAKAMDLVEGVFDPAQTYVLSSQLAATVKNEAQRRLAEKESAEVAQLEQSLGVGAKGRGTAAASRGNRGVFKELEEEHKRRRQRTERDLLDLALTDMVGLFRDALMVSAGMPNSALINPDRARTAAELARRVSAENLVRCIDAVMETRGLLNTAVTSATLLAGLMGQLQVVCNIGVR